MPDPFPEAINPRPFRNNLDVLQSFARALMFSAERGKLKELQGAEMLWMACAVIMEQIEEAKERERQEVTAD